MVRTSRPCPAAHPHIDPDNPPTATIRDLLTAAFTPENLRRFCQDRHGFQPAVAKFGPGHGLDDMVDRVIDHCRTQLLWDELLTGVAQVNPRQYARFEPRLREHSLRRAPDATVEQPSDFWVMSSAELRRWLDQRFDDPSLEAFVLDYFPEVYGKFSRGMRKDEKITLLLDHCRHISTCRQKLVALVQQMQS